MSSTTATLTADYLNPVITSTQTVFSTMLGCEPKRTGLTFKDTFEPQFEVSAVIGVTGRAAGTIVVSMSKESAINTLDRLLGTRADDLNADVLDAVGELTNMIAGSAKAKLASMDLSISIPNIISGPGHRVHYPTEVKPICIAFESEIGPFAIEVGFSNLK